MKEGRPNQWLMSWFEINAPILPAGFAAVICGLLMIVRVLLSTKLWSMPPEKKKPTMENRMKKDTNASATPRMMRVRCSFKKSGISDTGFSLSLAGAGFRFMVLFIFFDFWLTKIRKIENRKEFLNENKVCFIGIGIV